MRGCQCYYSIITKKYGEIVKNSNSACWQGISYSTINKKYVLKNLLKFDKWGFSKNRTNYNIPNIGIYKKISKDGNIYIVKYKEKETLKYVDLVVGIVNQITPCEIVKLKGRHHIKYKLLDTYGQNLVVLNFIRYLWHTPGGEYFDRDKFFTTLKNSKRCKDPLKRLLWANKVACSTSKFSSHHSAAYTKKRLLIRGTKELFKHVGKDTLFYTKRQ